MTLWQMTGTASLAWRAVLCGRILGCVVYTITKVIRLRARTGKTEAERRHDCDLGMSLKNESNLI